MAHTAHTGDEVLSADTYQCGRCGADVWGTRDEAIAWHTHHASFECTADWSTRTLIRVTYEEVSLPA